MNNQQSAPAGQLPTYITSATPLGTDKRAPWFKNVAPTYAGIFLWFDCSGRTRPWARGPAALWPRVVGWALFSLVVAALVGLAGTATPAQEQLSSPVYIIEDIQIRGNVKTEDCVIRRALRVHPGERLSVEHPRFELSRYRVLSLGFFSEVRLKLEKGSSRRKVILVVEVEELVIHKHSGKEE